MLSKGEAWLACPPALQGILSRVCLGKEPPTAQCLLEASADPQA